MRNLRVQGWRLRRWPRVLLACGGLGVTTVSSAGLLLAIYDQALERAPQWLAAAQAHQAVVAAEPIARAELLPRLWVDGRYGRSRVDITDARSPFVDEDTNYGNLTGAGVQLEQPLFDRAAAARSAQYQQTRDYAEQQLITARQQLVYDVGERYLLWLEAESALAYADAHATAMNQHLDQMQSREELGLATQSDRLLIQAERDRAESLRIEAAAALRAARGRIRELLGRVPDVPTELRTPIELQNPAPADPDAWVAQALQSSPNHLRAQAALEKAREQVREQSGRRWPRVALNLEHRYNDSNDFQLGSEAQTSRAEVQLTLPLYEGGAVRAAVAVAEATAAQREAELWEVDRAIDRDTRNAYDGVVTGVVRVRAARQTLNSANAARDAISGRYDTGLATLAELLSATGKVREALRDLAVARHRYLISRLRLDMSVGDLDRDDLAHIDAMLLPR